MTLELIIYLADEETRHVFSFPYSTITITTVEEDFSYS